jgi:hypothetical protein
MHIVKWPDGDQRKISRPCAVCQIGRKSSGTQRLDYFIDRDARFTALQRPKPPSSFSILKALFMLRRFNSYTAVENDLCKCRPADEHPLQAKQR